MATRTNWLPGMSIAGGVFVMAGVVFLVAGHYVGIALLVVGLGILAAGIVSARKAAEAVKSVPNDLPPGR